MKFLRSLLILACQLAFISTFAQSEEPNPFDFGKMWTFENPPKAWFAEAYNFEPDQAWFDSVRLSSLRFATWCSASFVSPDGLIMTNHHCSRGEAPKLQQGDENFDISGFYAPTLADERKLEGLFVEQMVMMADITDEVAARVKNPGNDVEEERMVKQALEAVKEAYSRKPGWEGLRLQTVTFYSGVKHSLYGYKRYDDIRLVFIPELDLGYYGGDPDNYTYPRYTLDVTFWRAYGEDGKPLDTSGHYFPFNPDGITQGETTFVVGNPGTTERFRTVSQLEFDRDYRYPMMVRYFSGRYDFFMEEYNQLSDDPARFKEVQQKRNQAFNNSNYIKRYGGILAGLHKPELLKRKVDMENYVRSMAPDRPYWDQIASETRKLEPLKWAEYHLTNTNSRGRVLRGNTLNAMHLVFQLEKALETGKPKAEVKQIRKQALDALSTLEQEREQKLFRILLHELNADIYPGDNTLNQVLNGLEIDRFVDEFFSSTQFTDAKKAQKLLSSGKRMAQSDDIFLRTARILVGRHMEARELYAKIDPVVTKLNGKVVQEYFKVFGAGLPPDATFTLRIADGYVDGFEYNGTEAPFKTTYFGLYDRAYSNDGQFPWALPDKWKNPPMDLLKAPLNFSSTNDIVGGNSGSPIINKNREAIGLIFDTNIQATPSRFIFDRKEGRTVSVHAGGIYAALKYIYKADRIVEELDRR